MLQLEKSSIHLVEEFRGDTEWPNREGRFDLSGFPDGSYFQVAGTYISGVLGFGRSSNPNLSSPSGRSTNRSFSPMFRFDNYKCLTVLSTLVCVSSSAHFLKCIEQ